MQLIDVLITSTQHSLTLPSSFIALQASCTPRPHSRRSLWSPWMCCARYSKTLAVQVSARIAAWIEQYCMQEALLKTCRGSPRRIPPLAAADPDLCTAFMHHLFDYINRMLTELVAALEVRGWGREPLLFVVSIVHLACQQLDEALSNSLLPLFLCRPVELGPQPARRRHYLPCAAW